MGQQDHPVLYLHLDVLSHTKEKKLALEPLLPRLMSRGSHSDQCCIVSGAMLGRELGISQLLHHLGCLC